MIQSIPLYVDQIRNRTDFLYGITFLLLSTGKKWFRILYWINIAISFLIIYFPIKLLLSNLTTILPFFVLVACMLLKTIVLCQIGGYLRNNRWCKIYFDHTIELDDENDDWVAKQTKNVDYEKIKDKYEKKNSNQLNKMKKMNM